MNLQVAARRERPIARERHRRPLGWELHLPAVRHGSAEVRDRACDRFGLRPHLDDVAQGVRAAAEPADGARSELAVDLGPGGEPTDLAPPGHAAQQSDGFGRVHPSSVVESPATRIRLSTGHQRRQFKAAREALTPTRPSSAGQLPMLVSRGSGAPRRPGRGRSAHGRRARSSPGPRSRCACCPARPSRWGRRRG